MKGVLCFFFILILTGCGSSKMITENRLAGISDERVRGVLSQALTAAGGWSKWNKWEQISYSKAFTLFDENGNEEFSSHQEHNYLRNNGLELNISTLQKGNITRLQFVNNESFEYVNGVKQDSNEEGIYMKIMTSWFAFALPWKLTDPGITFEFLGENVSMSKRRVNIIKAQFDANDNSNHTKSDTWLFSFDKESGELLEYTVQHGDTFARVVNDEPERIRGFVFPGKRTSYRVDASGNILFKRASYVYGGYKVEF